MTANEICEKYLKALNEGSLENVLTLFDTDAIVISPLYGEMSAKKFYNDLFADTNRSVTKLLNVFISDSGNSSAALHFHYTWTLKNGTIVEFECVDIIEIGSETNKITKLKIIYDTAPLRADFIESKS